MLSHSSDGHSLSRIHCTATLLIMHRGPTLDTGFRRYKETCGSRFASTIDNLVHSHYMTASPAMLLHIICFAGVAYAYSCIDFNVPITVTAPSYIPAFPEFANHYDSVQLLVDITSRITDGTVSPFSGSENVTVTFAIDASFCTKEKSSIASPDVQILTHGLGTDKSYWEFGGQDSAYNYIRAGTKAGYATLHWSRPGTGSSSSGDPYKILQADIQAAVLIEITRLLRSGGLHVSLPRPSRVLHVGYSFGSLLTNMLIAKRPELSDGVVLIGLSHNLSFSTRYAITTNFHLAREIRPSLWGNHSTGFLTWADELTLQYQCFKHPYFDPKALVNAEKYKEPFAVGELLTLGVSSLVAPDFKGPVLVSSQNCDTFGNRTLIRICSLRPAIQIRPFAEAIAHLS